MFLPFVEVNLFPPDYPGYPLPAYKESIATFMNWVWRKQPILVTDLGTYAVQGTVSVDGNVVTVSPGTIIELPPFAAIQFHSGDQKFRLVIGSTEPTSPPGIPVTIRPQTGGGNWAGFDFWPGDKYGDGPDGVIEILSPFRFEGMNMPFRFYQITKSLMMY